MKALKLIIVLIFGFTQVCFAQNKEESNSIKNVILLIPDGASVDVLALSRWYNDNKPLAVDEIICGMVKTYNSDGKFPDSAPTSTAYATGSKSNKKNIGVNEVQEPRISVLELARIKGLSTGVVATCEFPHATPADFVCHYNDRDNYAVMAKQFIYNSPSLVFAGGQQFLHEYQYLPILQENNIHLYTERTAFDSLTSLSQKPVWGLFPNWQGKTKAKSYECDRNPDIEPSLSEMTDKAIKLLSQNPKGFFLMVEGSQIDWAAHNNDPYAVITDFVEFDKAVAIALEFAKKDGNTIVIVCPDHGNGGISLGNSISGTDFLSKNPNKYEKIGIKQQLIEPLKTINWSARKMAEMMNENKTYISKDSIKKYYNLNITNNIINSFHALYKIESPKVIDTVQYILGSNFSSQNFIGWTTTGHTAEDVFLGIYTPKNIKRLTGVIDNSQVGKYIADVLKLGDFDIETNKYFSSHDKLFEQNEIKEITPDSILIRKFKKDITIYSNTNKIRINNIVYFMPTIAVYINKEGKSQYYFSNSIKDVLQRHSK